MIVPAPGVAGPPSSVPAPVAVSARRGRGSENQRILLGRIGLLALILVAWQTLSGPVIDPFFVSSPLAVANQLLRWAADGTLWRHTGITLQETLEGLAAGIVVGVAAGFLVGPHRVLGKVLDPFIMILNSIPKVALAPLFLVWFGIGIEMKVILAAVVVFFLIFFNTVAGVRGVDPQLVDAVRLMGASERAVLTKVVLPSALSWIITGMRIAVPYALIGAVIGELIASNRGLGYLLLSSASQLNTAGTFAALLVISAFAMLLNVAIDVLEAHTTGRWNAHAAVTTPLT
jgi:NitT/TauT family transport system permease protein